MERAGQVIAAGRPDQAPAVDAAQLAARLRIVIHNISSASDLTASPCRWTPLPTDRRGMRPAVGCGHLTAGNVGADGGGRDAQECSHIACCPPVAGKRLRHGCQATALTLPHPGLRLRPHHGDRDAGPFRLGHVARRLSVSLQRGIARAAPRGEPAAKVIKHGTTAIVSAIADQNGGSARVLPDVLHHSA